MAGRGPTALWQVDSYRRGPRMLATCRPEKAARFVFRGWLLLHRANARTRAGSNLQ